MTRPPGALRATASRLSRPIKRSTGGVGQGLGRRQPHPQPGIRARPQADREHLDVAEAKAGFAQSGRQPGNQVAPVAPRRLGRRREHRPDRTDRPIAARSVDVSSARMFILSVHNCSIRDRDHDVVDLTVWPTSPYPY